MSMQSTHTVIQTQHLNVILRDINDCNITIKNQAINHNITNGKTMQNVVTIPFHASYDTK